MSDAWPGSPMWNVQVQRVGECVGDAVADAVQEALKTQGERLARELERRAEETASHAYGRLDVHARAGGLREAAQIARTYTGGSDDG